MALRPYQYHLIYRLIPLGYYLLRVYLSLLKIRVVGEEIALGCMTDYGQLIIAIWHQRFLPALAYVTRFRHFEPVIMISQSRDGELAARFAERLGLVPVRGSSSRGGTTALSAIIEALKKNTWPLFISRTGPGDQRELSNLGSSVWLRYPAPSSCRSLYLLKRHGL